MKRAVFLAVTIAATASTAALADVKGGIEAWQRGDYAAAVKLWQPDADRGDADAEFNLGQAYKLGKGVPIDLVKAQGWYKKAADQGHQQALANYGLIMFQSGKRAEALPFLTKAADRGEPRAQYVVGTALFNGDFGTKDWPRAYAYMSSAAASGLPQATASLAEMDKFVGEPDRQKGRQIAMGLGKPAPIVDSLAAAQAIRPGASGWQGIAPSTVPASQPQAAPPPPPVKARPAPAPRPAPPVAVAAAAKPAPAPKPPRAAAAAPAPVAGGKWRIQLGAYSSPAAANAAWGKVSGKLAGFSRITANAGTMTRLQTGPFASRAAAAKACAAAGVACIPVPAP